jgi:hypothetical protein
VPGNFQQRQAEIQTCIRPALSAPHPFACQFAVPAAQVKQRLIATQCVQYPLNAGLEPLARGRKFTPEGLVELFIQGKQPRDSFGFYICV